MYASAQTLDFLAMTKNAYFPNWKLAVSHPGFPDGYCTKPIMILMKVDARGKVKSRREGAKTIDIHPAPNFLSALFRPLCS